MTEDIDEPQSATAARQHEWRSNRSSMVHIERIRLVS